MMDLKEPKKKKRVRLQAQPSLPIKINDNGEWRVYTAHLSASGTCIVDPVEMEAVYSMGFFGKGSLSRSFPSFGRRRFGAPPIIRNRQWTRRQRWLEELEKLNKDSNSENLEMAMGNGTDDDFPRETISEESSREEVRESTSEMPAEAEKITENESDENNSKQIDADESCSEKAPEFVDEIVKGPEKASETGANDSSLELVEKKTRQLDFQAAKEVEESADKKVDAVLAEDEKSQKFTLETSPAKTTRTVVNEIQMNSSIEFIGEESCVKRAKMDYIEKAADDDRGERSFVVCDESANVDEVLLDSTEDEEICEIVEKSPNDKRSLFFDYSRAINDEIFAEKSHNFFANDESMNEEEINPYELLVIPDTDSDTDNYLKNVKTKIEKDGFPVNETLHLTFEETFFLMYGLGCLRLIHYDGSIFSIMNAWNYFQQQDKYFIQKYVVYHYFRSKGWIVKPGMKFGGDFLLYKQGPPFYHASYIVAIEVMDADTLIRDDFKSMRKITWKNLLGLERLSETIAKEILFAQILWPSSIVRDGNTMPVEALSEFTVRELLWRRWNPKRKHDATSVDDEDSDSM